MNDYNHFKNSELLQELAQRIKAKKIRFTQRLEGQCIGGLLSWDKQDQYWLDLTRLDQELGQYWKTHWHTLETIPKNHTDQELIKQLIDELGLRAKNNPTEFIPRLKTTLPYLQLLIGENPLKNCTDQELIDEITKRIENFSLDPTSLIHPFVLIGSQYFKWYGKEKLSRKELKEYEQNK